MTPKITNEMREALHRNHGRPVEVEDEKDTAIYVLIDKDTFAHLQETQGKADEETRQHLKSMIDEGVKSGDYQPADVVFSELRSFVAKATPKKSA